MSAKDQQNFSVIDRKDNGNGNGNGNNGNDNGIQIGIKRPHLDERFITNIKGKDFVLYSGLLDLSHQLGLKKLQVQPIQYPTKDNGNIAICKAIAETQDGKVTEDIGDCNPTNCHTMVSKHVLRMASTRAKARALRDLTNIGITCIDEIGDFDEVIGEEIPPETKLKTRRRRSPAKKFQNDPKSDNLPVAGSNGGKPSETPNTNSVTESIRNNGGPKMSLAQKRALENLGRRKGLSMEDIDKMTREMYRILDSFF